MRWFRLAVKYRKKFFGTRDRYLQARNVVLLEEPCSNPKFIKFRVEKTIDGLITNYKFSFQSTENVYNNTIYHIDERFQTESG